MMKIFKIKALKIFKQLIILLSAGFFFSCAFAPGMDGNRLSKKYDVEKTPEIEDQEYKDVKIRKIDAYLIKELSNLDNGNSISVAQPSITKDRPYVYRLGVGDVLSIIVWDHPELTIPEGSFRSAEDSGTVVGQDGTIFFPYAGRMNIAGKTLRQVQEILTNKLSRYIENVQLDIRVAAYRSQRVYVVGEVNKPGVQSITDIRPTILEVINKSGGFTEDANDSEITLTRKGKVYTVNLRKLFEKGAEKNNVELINGDIVNIPNAKKSKVFVLGEVLKPGAYQFNKGKKTLADALTDASGANQLTADTGQIYVMRSDEKNIPEIFHLNAASPDAMLLADKFSLKERDVVYVDSASVVRWNRLLSNIISTTSVLDKTVELVDN